MRRCLADETDLIEEDHLDHRPAHALIVDGYAISSNESRDQLEV